MTNLEEEYGQRGYGGEEPYEEDGDYDATAAVHRPDAGTPHDGEVAV